MGFSLMGFSLLKENWVWMSIIVVAIVLWAIIAESEE